ncbi:hypothetical protein Q7C_1490 [Methylophaga frappieri]|uniref:T6SS Phospholipase effector Tle1-like catalytic domain-containing protein n=1 Tax=Methylophaga frappieri (strain ATCC BAA-2434 / DSM 25690 / JAM7) TaxID=754477 RepID=I1YI96_METFJ|nr:DUF2235 domain-containing protein [Methylophaga frappieri]AFJ02639.1 hypothetical protein Q7C_1490 [Methylophaga frappieri]
MNKQRLIVLFDGTWNDPEDQTNVYRLSRQIHDYDGEIHQRFFYDPGVGTSKLSRFLGGTFGYGLSENLRQGYEWLVKRYSAGDEIWVFGFSRGAYTARSLVGMIRKCGLLHITKPKLLDDAEKLYRNKEAAPDSDECKQFRATYSREVKIHFIGVWDTVGALGIPGTNLSEYGKYSWHDTELSSIVERAYHAMALDEFRAVYDVALWTSPEGTTKPSQLALEQRWFIGAHANVGGGYGADPLADISLAWMSAKARNAGLVLDDYAADNKAWHSAPAPSFNEFLGGAYAFFRRLKAKGDGKHFRKYATGHNDYPAVNVTVDESVWQRWRDPQFSYKPKTLVDAGLEAPE